MAASYPSSVRVFTTKVNVVDTVDASHPNSLQEEVVAIEQAIGTNPSLSTAPSPSGTFNSSAYSFNTVSDRLANIETGIVSDAHTQYIKKTADGAATNLISTASATNRGLIVKGAASQSANLQEWRSSADSVLAAVQSDGTFTGKVIGSQIQGSISAVPADATITSISANYPIVLADKNVIFYCTNSSDITITVPTDTEAFPVGSQLGFVRGSTGNVTFAATSPATVNATPGLKLRAQWSGATLLKIASNTWWLSGDLSA